MSRRSGLLSTSVPASEGLSSSGGPYWGDTVSFAGSRPLRDQRRHMKARLTSGRRRSQFARRKRTVLSSRVGRATTPGFHATAIVRPSR